MVFPSEYAPADEDWSASQRVIPLDNVSVPRNHYYLIRLGSHGPSGSEVLSYDQARAGNERCPRGAGTSSVRAGDASRW